MADSKREVDPRLTELSQHFSSGHPDGLSPAHVRSYGGIVRAEGTLPERKSKPAKVIYEEKVEQAQRTADTLSLRRAPDSKAKTEGTRGGIVERHAFEAEGLQDFELEALGFKSRR